MAAFVPAVAAPRASASSFVSSRCVVAARPAAVPARRRTAAPRMLAGVPEAVAALPLVPLAEEMRVTFPAYLAVFLGTLIPVAFLVILFIQSESRSAGERAGRGE